MAASREQRIKKMMGSAKSENEQKMLKLAIERICADMCSFYLGFYNNEGPGAIIYVPGAEDEQNSMFYLSLDCLLNALNDFNSRDMTGPAEIMQKTIARAEAIDPTKESLFIIQDAEHMSLIHYKHDNQEHSLLKMA